MRLAAVLPAALASVLLAAGCRAPRRPDPPRAPRASAAVTAVASAAVSPAAAAPASPAPPPPASEQTGSSVAAAEALRPYLERYPLGDAPSRVDLLAATARHSMHLVQTRRPIAAHHHPARAERVLVLSGSGTVYVGDRSYPAVAGAGFRFAPRTVHSVHPDEGSTLVAVTWFEPPLTSGDDRVYVRP